jgi:hypothetical protein
VQCAEGHQQVPARQRRRCIPKLQSDRDQKLSVHKDQMHFSMHLAKTNCGREYTASSSAESLNP